MNTAEIGKNLLRLRKGGYVGVWKTFFYGATNVFKRFLRGLLKREENAQSELDGGAIDYRYGFWVIMRARKRITSEESCFCKLRNIRAD